MSQLAHCRLCAGLKPRERLVDLQTDENQRTKTLEKLSRLGLHVKDLKTNEDVLPKTVCPVCVNLLDSAFNFVITVEEAQNVLSGHILAQGIKKDPIDLHIDNLPDVKIEEDLNTPPICSIIVEPTTTVPDLSSKIKVETDLSENVNVFENNFELHVNGYQMELKSKLNPDEEIDGINERSNKKLVNMKEVIEATIMSTLQTGTSYQYQADNVKELVTNQTEIPTCEKEISLDNVPSDPRSWKEYSWKCSLCEAVCASFDELNTHSMQLHNRCNTYQCTECTSKCYSLDNFTKHVGKHWQHLKLSCFKCYKKFRIGKDTQFHMKTHLESDHACTGCYKSFQTSEDLEKHILVYKLEFQYRLSPDLKKLSDGLTCLQCQRKYANKYELKRHILSIHSEKKQYSCERCGMLFFFKYNLDQHVKIHDESRPFQCKVCNKTFRTNLKLQSHIGVHDEVKPFSCEQCGKKFRLKSFLKYHLNTHSDARPWVCSYCNKAFKSRTNLNGHVKTHTGKRPYSCPICKTSFSDSSPFNRHMKTVHKQQGTKTLQ